MIDNIKKLRKASGDVFFEAQRTPDNAFIIVNWIGIQSMETIVMGSNHILSMLRERACPGLLNSNRELIGPWETAVSWLSYKWAPESKALGLYYFAHVLSPGIYGRRSFNALYPELKKILEIKAFDDEESAKAWLQLKSA